MNRAERGEHIPPPMKAPISRSPPYSPTQPNRLREWAESLTGQARADALASMALAGGCGLAPGNLAAVRGEHVRVLDSGAVAVTTPEQGRVIVARRAWEQQVAEAAQAAGGRYLFRPRRTIAQAKNVSP